MLVFLNNKSIELTHEITIHELLTVQNISAERGVAIAINNTVIQKKLWEKHIISDNDKITIIKATQGG